MCIFAGFLHLRSLHECKQKCFLLALICVVASGMGVLFAVLIGEPYVLMMRKAVGCPVSIVGSILTVCVPFLLFVFLVVHSRLWLVFLLCAVRIFFFSATGYALHSCFGSGAWLMCIMFQFPDICLNPILLYLGLRRLLGNCSTSDVPYCAVVTFAVGMINSFVISPFWVNLIESYETIGRYAIHVGLDRCL